jgi:hypothetical protein
VADLTHRTAAPARSAPEARGGWVRRIKSATPPARDRGVDAAGLLAGGTAGAVVLIAGFGYPASMVGVTGAEVSNLSPPTLAAVCFGIAQVGLTLLVRAPLTRLMRRPGLWAVVALANASAMTIFLWHQTALTVTAVTALRFGDVPGLLSTPDEPIWLLHRLAWFPVLAALLSIIWLSVFAKGRFNDRVSSSA